MIAVAAVVAEVAVVSTCFVVAVAVFLFAVALACCRHFWLRVLSLLFLLIRCCCYCFCRSGVVIAVTVDIYC